YLDKATALPVRCLRDAVVKRIPSVSNITFLTSDMTANSALGTATVASDGGSEVTERGLCWTTSGTPDITSGTKIPLGAGTGTFSPTMTGLTEGPTYYVRAYATNSTGTAYSP
ncbi:hypothetical protein, partial [Arcticibacter tournemirensis]